MQQTHSTKAPHLLSSFTVIIFLSVSCGQNSNESAPKNIFGTDNRVELDINSYPGKAVGRLDGGCSGAMVGKRIALTAAHCVYDKDTDALRSNVKYFKAGYKNGRESAKSWISAVWIGSKTPEEERSNDWALLLFSDSIGDKTGWFGIRTYNTPTFPITINTAGYSNDKSSGDVLMVAKNCYAHKLDEKNRLLHDCDGANGVSGGPMYVVNGNDALIIGITAAEFRTGDRSMQRDSYSHEYANIGLMASQFEPSLTELKAATDLAAAMPTITGAFRFVNNNSSNDTTNNVNTTRDLQQSEIATQIYNLSASIKQDADLTLRAANSVANFARINGFRNIHDRITPVVSPAQQLASYAWQLQSGTMLREAGANAVLQTTPSLTKEVQNFISYFNATYPVSSRVAYDLRLQLNDLRTSAARLAANIAVN